MVLREMLDKCSVRLVMAPEVTRLNPFLLGLLVVRLVLLEPVSKEEEMVHGFLLCFLVIDVDSVFPPCQEKKYPWFLSQYYWLVSLRERKILVSCGSCMELYLLNS